MTRVFVVVVAILLVYSCGGGDVAVTQTGNPSQVSLYTQVGGKKAQNLTVVSKRSLRDDDEDITSITIQSAYIVVEEVVLLGDDGDELSFHGDAPYVINVALDSTRQLVDSIVDTSGASYHSASLFLTPLEAEDASEADTVVGHSIVISGYANGDTAKDFTFYSDSLHLLEIPFETPFVVNNKGTSALFITLDVGSWFQDDDGELLDPFDDDFHGDIQDAIIEGIYGTEEDEDDWDDEEDDDDEDDEKDEEDEEDEDEDDE